ncbi:MAG: TIGR04219 family outer membrane beta-barrel protein [Campylobacterota bacterium]|nr:TIGR04219 family outer membrane beta-barrel protein [Campylobacterota bacterium]
MQKILLSTAAISLLLTSLSADMIRIEGAVGSWNAEPSGTMNYEGSQKFSLDDTLGYDTENITYAWLLFKHPIPIIPNLRLEYNNLGYSGISNDAFSWEGEDIGVGSTSSLDLTHYDAILYYNILDNTAWTTVDLGLGTKYIDGAFDISDPSDGYTYSSNDSIILPMIYARGRVEVPMTGLGLEADIKWIGYGGANAYDFRVKADYTLDIFIVEPLLEIGYRTLSLNIDAEDLDMNADTDIEFSGLYFGVGVQF